MPINYRGGKWVVVNESPEGVLCTMTYWDTREEAEKDCKEYARQSPDFLELTWFIRYEHSSLQK